MKPYSMDLRTRVVQAYEHHEGAMRQLAITFRVSLSCVRRLLKHHRETGSVAPKAHGGGDPAKVDVRGLEVVQALVRAAPDATLRELCQRFEAQPQRCVSRATMSRVLARLQRTRKKNVSRHGTRARRVQRQRVAFCEAMPECDPKALVVVENPAATKPWPGTMAVPLGTSVPRCQAGPTRAPCHDGRGVGRGRGVRGHDGRRLCGRGRLSGLCAGSAGPSTAARAGGGARSPQRPQVAGVREAIEAGARLLSLPRTRRTSPPSRNAGPKLRRSCGRRPRERKSASGRPSRRRLRQSRARMLRAGLHMPVIAFHPSEKRCQ